MSDRRSFVVWGLLLTWSVGTVGLPLPQVVGKKDAGRFPCEQRPCGCSDAQRCWDRCCCHSDAEKLRWAAENGVSPPAFLVRRVARTAVAARSIHGDVPVNLSTGAFGAVSESPPSSTPTCCRPDTAATPPVESCGSSVACDDAEDRESRIATFESLAKCRGVDLFWGLAAAVILEDICRPFVRPPAPLLDRLVHADEHAESADHLPDAPVPWREA